MRASLNNLYNQDITNLRKILNEYKRFATEVYQNPAIEEEEDSK